MNGATASPTTPSEPGSGPRSVYIASAEGHTGKSLVAVGLIDLFIRRVSKVGVFRPVVRVVDGGDEMGRLLRSRGGFQPTDESGGVGVTYEDVHADPDGALERIVESYHRVDGDCEVMVIVGSDYTDIASPTELTFNGRVAANLGAPVILVVSGFDRSPDDVSQLVEIALAELSSAHASTIAVVANRCDPAELELIREALLEFNLPTWVLPEAPLLSAPLVTDVMDALGGELLFGDPAMLSREAEHMLVCGMGVEHVLERLEEGQLCISTGDRADVLVALAAAHAAPDFPSLAGLVLNGGYRPGPMAESLVEGLDAGLPIVLTDLDSYETARRVASTRGRLARGSQRKIDTALAVFEDNIDVDGLMAALAVPVSDVVTPLMFESMLLDRARSDIRHIVLPESEDERILRAAATLLARGVVELTLLGVESQVRARAGALGLDISAARIVDPHRSDLVEPFAAEYTRLRSHKGMKLDPARDIVRDVSYFGTMMVHSGLADGMVSGATHSTAHTITPAFEIIKTTPGTEVVSSVFFMCLADRVLVYGDCAVIPDPTAEELADIAIASAQTAARFGVDARVAMLSYSTGSSGHGVDVDKVRAATEMVHARRPDLAVEGPLQYDAAVDAVVAEAKLPGSQVAGRATVFIFPDLNTGNNTYKAVQRSAGAVAIGPVLQGLRKPVNDLSRGATVRDIINTVAITAAQASYTADDEASRR